MVLISCGPLKNFMRVLRITLRWCFWGALGPHSECWPGVGDDSPGRRRPWLHEKHAATICRSLQTAGTFSEAPGHFLKPAISHSLHYFCLEDEVWLSCGHFQTGKSLCKCLPGCFVNRGLLSSVWLCGLFFFSSELKETS